MCSPAWLKADIQHNGMQQRFFRQGQYLRYFAGLVVQKILAFGSVGCVLPSTHLLPEFVVKHVGAGPYLHGFATVADVEYKLPV